MAPSEGALVGGPTRPALRLRSGPAGAADSGGACFDLESGDGTVAVSLNDGAFDPTSGLYQFEDDRFVLDGGPFCDSVAVDVPAGSQRLLVFVDVAGAPGGACGAGGLPSVAGSIDVIIGHPFFA